MKLTPHHANGRRGRPDRLARKTVRVEKRKTANGYTIAEQPNSGRSSHDGQATDNPNLDALREIDEIDIFKEAGADGKLREARAYERRAEVLKSRLPEAVAAELVSGIGSVVVCAVGSLRGSPEYRNIGERRCLTGSIAGGYTLVWRRRHRAVTASRSLHA